MNKKMTKITLSLIVATMIATMLCITPAYAGTTDTFTVTVRGKYLDIQINRSTWAINSDAAIDMSSTYESNATDGAESDPYFTAILYNNSVAVDLGLHISANGSDWGFGNAIDADTFVINATHDLWVTPAECIILNHTTTILKAGIAADTNQTFDLRFYAPSSTTSGDLQTITITATVSEN